MIPPRVTKHFVIPHLSSQLFLSMRKSKKKSIFNIFISNGKFKIYLFVLKMKKELFYQENKKYVEVLTIFHKTLKT